MQPGPEILRHMTVTGFLVFGGRVLLHWHRRNQLWLPMGGHIELNEDPIQAVLREVLEESGVEAEVLPTAPPVGGMPCSRAKRKSSSIISASSSPAWSSLTCSSKRRRWSRGSFSSE